MITSQQRMELVTGILVGAFFVAIKVIYQVPNDGASIYESYMLECFVGSFFLLILFTYAYAHGISIYGHVIRRIELIALYSVIALIIISASVIIYW